MQSPRSTIAPAPQSGDALTVGVYREVLDAQRAPTAILDGHGLVVACNRALLDLLRCHVDQVVGEPLLAWFPRTGETAAFGRSFMGLRSRAPGHGFELELHLAPAAGRVNACRVEGRKLSSGHVLVTCVAKSATQPIETDVGGAIKRSLEALDQGMLLLDASGCIVHANPAASTLLGAGLRGRSFLELINPTQVDAFSESLGMASAGTWHDELDLCTLDGETVPVELSLAAGRGEGAPAVVLFRDLVDRRQRQFEDRVVALVYRQLLSSPHPRENVPAACSALVDALGLQQIAVVTQVGVQWERWSVDSEHAVRVSSLPESALPPPGWNTGARLTRVAQNDPDMRRVFGPHGASAGLRMVLEAPSGVVAHVLIRGSNPAIDAPATRALLVRLAPQLGLSLANGLLLAETEELADYQSMLLDQTTVMLISLDGAGRIVSWNRASEQLFGIPAEQAEGRLFGVDVALSSDQDRWQELWKTLVERGAIASEVVVKTRESRDLPLHIEGRILRDHDAVKGAVLVGLDLRHRRALEDQVLKSQKLAAVGLLAAGIAHEINNPLSGVVGYSKLLLERRLEDDIRTKVQKIADSGERCRKIVEGVLLFSRQQESSERRVLDLRGVIERVVAIGEYQWRMHNVQIIREIAAGPLLINGDSDQLEQVMLNLLSNAVDAMPRGGTVRISLTHDLGREGQLRLDVSDEGHGIPEEIRVRIFDPFFSTKEIGKGTGLGLAISYGIIKDHGGDILVESEPGVGTTFSVLLPSADATSAPPSPAPTPSV